VVDYSFMKFSLPLFFIVLSLMMGVFVLSVVITQIGVRFIEQRNPPLGQFLSIDGEKLHYVEKGVASDQPTLIFFHGASSNLLDMMLAFDDQLSGHRLYFDRPGYGWSTRGKDDLSSPDKQAELIIKAIEALDVEKAYFFAHSWGTNIATQIALLRPDLVTGIVFISAATHPWPGGVTWHYQLAERPFIGWLFAHSIVLPVGYASIEQSSQSVFEPEPAPDHYAQKISASLILRPHSFRATAKDVARLKPFVTKAASSYYQITQPALIVTGDRDNVVYPEIHSKGLKNDLPNSTLLMLENVGHMPHHTHSATILKAAQDFFRDDIFSLKE
jgi:pimeloyl-ACP methyl ester carboxylesterase